MVAVTAHRVEPAPALPEAFERLASAAERAAGARLDLAMHGITQTVKSFGASAAMLAGALFIGIFAWLCLIAGSVALLALVMPLGLAFVIVGAVQLVIAAAVAVPALKTMRATPVTPGVK